MVKNAVFPGGSSLSAQTYNSLANIQKFITLRSFIVSGHVNIHWKEERVFYKYCSSHLARATARVLIYK
jgi:hypothetical protein